MTFTRSRIWSAVKVFLLTACVASVFYWTQLAPFRADVIAVAETDIVTEVMGTGTLEARVTASIGPKISGRIVEVLVDQGERVQAGQSSRDSMMKS